MKTILTNEDICKMKYNQPVQCICIQCNSTFTIRAARAKTIINQTDLSSTADFCSRKCHNEYKKSGITRKCLYCNNIVYVQKGKTQQKRFCSSACSASYNNTHKTTGNHRSKLECWLETKLTMLYPTIEIHFNRKDTIESELDIYIPSLKIAFELNGIYHYEPIHGSDLLNKIKNNDNRKFQACLERGIELCIIDSTKQVYFKESSSHQFLDIINNLIKTKIDQNGQ